MQKNLSEKVIAQKRQVSSPKSHPKKALKSISHNLPKEAQMNPHFEFFGYN